MIPGYDLIIARDVEDEMNPDRRDCGCARGCRWCDEPQGDEDLWEDSYE